MPSTFTHRVRDLISRIPPGKVTTYGLIAAGAGNGAGARQVARILHASSAACNLPWHRVINRLGRISLAPGRGYEQQRDLLEAEGVQFDATGAVDFARFLWRPDQNSR